MDYSTQKDLLTNNSWAHINCWQHWCNHITWVISIYHLSQCSEIKKTLQRTHRTMTRYSGNTNRRTHHMRSRQVYYSIWWPLRQYRYWMIPSLASILGRRQTLRHYYYSQYLFLSWWYYQRRYQTLWIVYFQKSIKNLSTSRDIFYKQHTTRSLSQLTTNS